MIDTADFYGEGCFRCKNAPVKKFVVDDNPEATWFACPDHAGLAETDATAMFQQLSLERGRVSFKEFDFVEEKWTLHVNGDRGKETEPSSGVY